ncbi:MAG: endonuclease/exonuclease/phosphatase family protein [Clostridia bacterium]|nr:endonuclease/exonuclease/phosphatase family protein [Clostridia bacterium]
MKINFRLLSFVLVLVMMTATLFGCDMPNSRSTSGSTSNSQSTEDVSSDSGVNSTVISNSSDEETSQSQSVSESISQSESDSTSESESTSESASQSESASDSSSESASDSSSESTSQSESASDSSSESTSQSQSQSSEDSGSGSQQQDEPYVEPEFEDEERPNEAIDLPVVKPDKFYTEVELTWISYNIRMYTSGDTGLTNWSQRGSHLIEYLNIQNVDIICFQEVCQNQYNALNGGLKGYSMIWYSRESGSNPEGLAIAYKTDKFKVLSQTRYWLSPTPNTQSKGWGESYYRILVSALLEHKETGIKFNLESVHMGLSTAAQPSEADLILSKIQNEKYPVLLAGDFNMLATKNEDGTYQYKAYEMFSSALNDLRLGFDNAEDLTFSAYNANPSCLLDYFFASKDTVRALSYQVLYDKWAVVDGKTQYAPGLSGPLSDHYGIKCTVRIKRV